ncbi:SpoIID/LytB domain-containing protein [Sporomusa acidovorans]|uniref:Sporulation stage II protein D amidase enhancer LytB N-terminal domain-containing protein n=1 Tax=Sporomusa acidovorans (strain ATCC 49682 / DSM 3132 / Mol) TaxID=1123286 RepID=A0ABZ3J4V3_SPOA4|nr:SpoIID/LytB domain-containing protein [Sporomusa acidovorans]OZC20891.1 amidase enhancer precursor [Sporomusa acidovorans DSM 3132]SDE60214.1 stage II sporulation protein D [Sporomusa acidovorans]
MLKWLLLVVFLVFPLAGNAQALDVSEGVLNEPILRVGILTNQPSIQISSDANFDIVNSGTAEILRSFRAYDGVTIAAKDTGGFVINGVPVAAAGLTVVQKKDDLLFYVEQHIYVNKHRYRGDISIHPTAGKAGITVVNTLPIEQYLYGIIKNEISPDWPMEAVKAQAVAARTYALANYNKHKADGFDVCATTDCQVYGGRESEVPRAREAVDATRGLVITYNGKLITAYFHSSSGGYTENSENVWSSPQPYLRGVTDFDQSCPYFKWEKRLTVAEFNQIITNAGYNVGSLQAIELSPLTTPPITSPDRGVSGRVKSLELVGTNGSAQVSGVKLRSILDLKSTLFDVDVIANEIKQFAMPVYAHNGKTERKPQITLPLIPKENPNIRSVSSSEPGDYIVIAGYGWGHGLGLSQWGAKAMAEKEQSGNPEYFKAILKHYYQGVEIKKAY